MIQLLERSGPRLDRAYVEKWIAELGLRSEWAEAMKQADSGPGLP